MSWEDELKTEFERAEAARAAGNEARARVCARRAAGIAVREHLLRRGEPAPRGSAYDLLQRIAADPGLDPGLREAAVRLTVRVTEAFELPVDVDLIAEARRLCEGLSGAGA